MSQPAERLVTPARGTRIASPPEEARAPQGAASRVTTRRARPHHLGFALLAAVLLGSMVFGIVVLNALLAQASFRIDQAERLIEELSAEHLDLVRQQATLSATGRIAAWATRHGMRLPDDIRILHAPGVGSADPAGAGTFSSAQAGPGA